MKAKRNAFDAINYLILGFLALIMFFPLYYVFIISVANRAELISASVYLLPVSFTMEAYRVIFLTDNFLNSIGVSVIVTVIGTILSMVCSVLMAYPLSKKGIPGMRFMFIYLLIPMFFSGGLIPYYLTIKAIGLVDRVAVLILPLALSVYNVIIMKNNFETVPASLEEAAKIDGANDMVILWRIVIPTCTPILATMALFYAVGYWNEWWHAMLFLQTASKKPLQLILRDVLTTFDQMVNGAVGQSLAQSHSVTYSRSVQMATVIIATVPILCVYPFLQRYFTTGLMLGSVKE